MRKKIEDIAACALLLVCAACIVYCIAYHISHPDMTDMRLAMKLWPVNVVAAVAGVSAIVIIRR